MPFVASGQVEFKYDDNVYKTIYSQDLKAFLEANPKTLLIDVRTPGEYADTSEFGSLNIGRLKNAINIPIDSIPKNIGKLKNAAANPIIVYCSHSQRSRRVSKTLMENGFTKVWNLNGGMSILNQCDEKDFPGKANLIVSNLPYKIIPANEAIRLIKTAKEITILDVRPVLQFEGKDTIQSQNIGRLKNAVNIPAALVKDNLAKLDKTKAILVYDINGAESSKTAKFLTDNGYANVYHLLGGLSAIIGKENETAKTRASVLTGTPDYTILNTAEAIAILSKPGVVVIDTRPAVNFNNSGDKPWQNIGHLKNAVNIPATEFTTRKTGLLRHKNDTIVIYGQEAADYCVELKKSGFKNVNLIYGGLWDILSATFNIRKFRDSRSLLVNHDGLY